MGYKITAQGADDFVVLPRDLVIHVKVVETKVETVPGKNGDDWDKLDFRFTITHVPDERFRAAEGQTIFGGVGFRLSTHPDNRLKQWVEALLGVEVTEGFELDTDMLTGRSARAIVENYTRNKGGEGHKVGALLPLAGPPAAQPVGQPAAQPVGQPAPEAPQAVQRNLADADVPF